MLSLQQPRIPAWLDMGLDIQLCRSRIDQVSIQGGHAEKVTMRSAGGRQVLSAAAGEV
jgi:hypothetical protein